MATQVLKAIVQPGHDPELLALLTVHPEAVLSQAATVVATTSMRCTAKPATGDVLEALVDTMVRLTLSHLIQTTAPIDLTVGRIATALSAFA
jgi:hypothetical protein